MIRKITENNECVYANEKEWRKIELSALLSFFSAVLKLSIMALFTTQRWCSADSCTVFCWCSAANVSPSLRFPHRSHRGAFLKACELPIGVVRRKLHHFYLRTPRFPTIFCLPCATIHHINRTKPYLVYKFLALNKANSPSFSTDVPPIYRYALQQTIVAMAMLHIDPSRR